MSRAASRARQLQSFHYHIARMATGNPWLDATRACVDLFASYLFGVSPIAAFGDRRTPILFGFTVRVPQYVNRTFGCCP
jgi:hypothetical protein